MSGQNLCKDSFVGDYPIVNCQYYGNFQEIEELKFGSTFNLAIDEKDKSTILVKSSTSTIGELQVSDVDKNKLLPYLKQGWNEIYICKLNQNCKDAKLNERLRVSIWVKKNNNELKKYKEIQDILKNNNDKDMLTRIEDIINREIYG